MDIENVPLSSDFEDEESVSDQQVSDQPIDDKYTALDERATEWLHDVGPRTTDELESIIAEMSEFVQLLQRPEIAEEFRKIKDRFADGSLGGNTKALNGILSIFKHVYEDFQRGDQHHTDAKVVDPGGGIAA